MAYSVLETRSFAEIFESLDFDRQNWIRKMILQLEQTPFAGKPLGFKWLREKKFKDKRLYYIVYPKINRVLLVAFGGKKEQQKIISHILQNLGRYNKIVGANQ